jgi:acyl carrier protein
MTTLDKIKDALAVVVPLPNNLDENTKLASFHLDSLDYVELVQELEDIFQVEINDQAAKEWLTVGDIVKTVEGK